MPPETPIARDIRVAGADSQGDAACRKLLSHKIFLAWLLKECLAEYNDYTVEEIAQKYIEGQPWVNLIPVDIDETNPAMAAQTGPENPVIKGERNEDTSQTEGKAIFDILFYALKPGQTNEYIRLFVNVEAQGEWYLHYPLLKRSKYYTSRMISSQKGRDFFDSDYAKLCKVASIWICLNPPTYWQNTINRYYMIEDNLVGNAHAPQEQYDLETIALVCLGPPEGENYGGTLEMLEILLSEQRQVAEKQRLLKERFAIEMTEEMREEAQTMYNYGQGMFEKGRAAGIEQGIAQGREQGLARGIEQGMEKGIIEGKFAERLANIQSLIITLRLSPEQAMEALNISPEERSSYLPHIKPLN